jgi:hypothetical protein
MFLSLAVCGLHCGRAPGLATGSILTLRAGDAIYVLTDLHAGTAIIQALWFTVQGEPAAVQTRCGTELTRRDGSGGSSSTA